MDTNFYDKAEITTSYDLDDEIRQVIVRQMTMVYVTLCCVAHFLIIVINKLLFLYPYQVFLLSRLMFSVKQPKREVGKFDLYPRKKDQF